MTGSITWPQQQITLMDGLGAAVNPRGLTQPNRNDRKAHTRVEAREGKLHGERGHFCVARWFLRKRKWPGWLFAGMCQGSVHCWGILPVVTMHQYNGLLVKLSFDS